MDDRILDKPFIDEKYGSYIRNIEGVIEHSYYHLGQIVLLKKMIVQNQWKRLASKHLITKDTSKMGHLDAVEIGKMKLYLPKR